MCYNYEDSPGLQGPAVCTHTINLTFDGVLLPLYYLMGWKGGGWLILFTLFLLVKTIKKVIFLEKKLFGKI